MKFYIFIGLDLRYERCRVRELKLLVQLDLEDLFTGQSLATFGPLQPTGDIITNMKQWIDMGIETLYQIIAEQPGLSCTVFRTLNGV